MNKFSRTTIPALAILAALTGCRHAEQEFPDASGRRSVQFRAVAADTLTAGIHTIDARLTFSDGSLGILSLEIDVTP